MPRKVPLSLTYARAGVNIAAGDEFVRIVRKEVRSTYSSSVLGDIGAFGGLFRARFKGLRDPVLVSSVDGVGTKLLIAHAMGKHDTVGQDLVNHCVNDILACGARPLFFLDYFATGTLDLTTAHQIIHGFAAACRENGCALIGGETAEMPGMYAGDTYDLSGTIVGVVERRDIIDGRRIRKGDVLIGLPSTGLHTNGYSLARAVLLKEQTVNDYRDDLGRTIGEALLAVHRSYLHTVTALMKKFRVHGLAHITGGGIVGNTRRIMPKGRDVQVDWNAWKRPMIFQIIQRTGGVPEEDMRSTFNLGVGMVVVAAAKKTDDIIRFLHKRHEAAVIMGRVI